MANIDHIIKKLNIHGVNSSELAGGGGEAELKIQDVFASLGYGDLSIEAYFIGLAVHRKDEYDIRVANRFAERISDRVFQEEEWSATKPYQNMVRALVKKGLIEPEQAADRKDFLGRKLKFNLGTMALFELLGPHVKTCYRCYGNGAVTEMSRTTPCKRCNGNGRIQLIVNEKVRSEHVHVGYDAWKKNWRYRYRVVQSGISTCNAEFHEHLVRGC